MENAKQTKAEEILNLDYSKKQEDKIWLSEQSSLRKIVGILGVLLPVLLFLFLFINTNYSRPLESISHYYYTRVSGIFIIIVSLLAIFLLIYKGKESIDFYLSSIAGLFAFCVVLFPTSNITDDCPGTSNNFSVTVLQHSDNRVMFHFISAGIFLSCLAIMSLFLFTKSDKPVDERTQGKKMRNKLYFICGIMMILALLVIFAGFLNIIHEPYYSDHHLTFWMETLAVEFFGISWLTKAEVFFKD